MRILVVDDDASFREFIAVALDQAGIEHVEATQGAEALSVLRDAHPGSFDLVLLDVEMPKSSGWDLLMELRAASNEIPVVFVTAKGSLDERVKGLQMGADDYITKPVEYRELIARIHAVLRRRLALPTITFGDLQLDLAQRRAQRGGKELHLSPREYDLLLTLVQGEGEVLTREYLLRKVWDIDFNPGTNLVEVHIGRLRKKLDQGGRPIIFTEKGRGYRAKAQEPSGG